MQQIRAERRSALRRDPAPSRIAYRANRLWLTPGFRLLLRAGLPAALAFGGMAFWFAQDDNRQNFIDGYAEMRRSVEERPEFMVQLMAIDGASNELADDIREILPLDFPISSFDLDLPAMKDSIGELDAVADAVLKIRPGGILQVQITERIPALVWRRADGLELLDPEGHRVSAVSARTDRSDLPLVAGEGAQMAVDEALRLFAAAEPVQDRVRGLVRMGARRWDMVLDRDQRIMLPETGAVAALEQVMALQQAQELLDRDLTVVDMRNPRRPTVRMAEMAADELRRIKAMEFGGDQ